MTSITRLVGYEVITYSITSLILILLLLLLSGVISTLQSNILVFIIT